jgi:hypothetical protein
MSDTAKYAPIVNGTAPSIHRVCHLAGAVLLIPHPFIRVHRKCDSGLLSDDDHVAAVRARHRRAAEVDVGALTAGRFGCRRGNRLESIVRCDLRFIHRIVPV